MATFRDSGGTRISTVIVCFFSIIDYKVQYLSIYYYPERVMGPFKILSHPRQFKYIVQLSMSIKPRNWEPEYRQSPKSLSKSAILKKTVSEKYLKKEDSLKHIPYKSSVGKIVPVSAHSPKFTSSKSQKTLVQGCSSIKRATLGKDKDGILVQRPKITKKKSNTELQDKIRSLEVKLEKLKTNFNKGEEKSRASQSRGKTNTKSKSKSRKSSNSKGSIKKSFKLSPTQQEEKNDTSNISNKGNMLDAYVTKMAPTQKSKVKKELSIKPLKQLDPNPLVSWPYYIDQAIRYINHDDDHPSKQHIYQSITTLNYLEKLPKPSTEAIHHIKIKLKAPLKSPETKTIVLDLDQTLIHCNDTGEISDFKVPITFPNGEVIEAGVNIRPHAEELLKNLSKHFQVIVFTASHSCYANVILDCLDPHQKYISQRVFRDHCYQTEEGMYIKDLRIFSNRDLAKLVLIDNAAHSYYFQLSNGIPIIPYYFDKKDTQLKSLQKFLMEQILPAKDVRPVLTNFFKLEKYKAYTSSEQLVQELYLSPQK